jgi:hypothetical protein
VLTLRSADETLQIVSNPSSPFFINVRRATVAKYISMEQAAWKAGQPTTREHIAAAEDEANRALLAKRAEVRADARRDALREGLALELDGNGAVRIFKLEWYPEAKSALQQVSDLPGFGPLIVAALVASIYEDKKDKDAPAWTPTVRWARSFLADVMNFSPRKVTSKLVSDDVRSQQERLMLLMKRTVALDLTDGVMPRLMYALDETGAALMADEGEKWAPKGSKRVKGSLYGHKDQFTVTITIHAGGTGTTGNVLLDGGMLPMQLLFAGKTNRVLPQRGADIPGDWLIDKTLNHWSNLEMKLKLLEAIARCVYARACMCALITA